MPTRAPQPQLPDSPPPIHIIRGFRVILDSDLARLYGISTMRLNQAVKRNADRFPSDFVFQLVPEEWEALNRSQNVTTSSHDGNLSQFVMGSEEIGEKPEISVPNLSQIAAGSQKHRDPRHLPWAFTEHGALMAGTILRSPTAVKMSLYVVRAFVKLRQIALENENLSRRMVEAEVALRQHDVLLTDLYDKLEPLLEPEAEPESVTRRKFGFETLPLESPTSTP